MGVLKRHRSNEKRTPGCLGYSGDYTSQIYGDYHKPLQGSLLNNQDFMEAVSEGSFRGSGSGMSFLPFSGCHDRRVWCFHIPFLLKVGEKNPENWQPQQFQVPTQLDSRITGFLKGVKFLTKIGVPKSSNYTTPKINSSPLKIDGWKMKFPFGEAYFQGLG